MAETRLETWREIFAERAERERLLRWKYPGFDVFYNWLIGALMLAVLVGLCIWGAQVGIERRDERLREAGRAEVYAQQAAAEQAAAEEAEKAQQALAAQIDKEAEALARMFFGIRVIAATYRYTERDFETYARSAFNRADARDQDLMTVIYEDGQYTACSRHNDINPEYKALAKRMVEEWHNETEKPCDTAFQYAELTQYGVFLKKAYGDGRWQA